MVKKRTSPICYLSLELGGTERQKMKQNNKTTVCGTTLVILQMMNLFVLHHQQFFLMPCEVMETYD